MKLTGNTILITGGGTGIGRELAEQFHKLDNQVVIAGRRRELLDETVKANPGMKQLPVDMQDAEAIRDFAVRVLAEFPTLNVLINNAGIMRPEKLLACDLGKAEAIVATNLLGPIRLTAALLPHLVSQPAATVMNISSGLAFLPLALTPTYCATKAAIHSYTMSLRYQMRNTKVEVLELAPPYVQTELMDGRDDPRAMPLKQFIAEVMEILKQQATPQEILVDKVKGLRFAERNGNFDEIFTSLNAARTDQM
jgi:uncharacterized oxidoreductase